ncbi:hypothetical protein ACFLY1_00110 [Patescibacteria group bacterium]
MGEKTEFMPKPEIGKKPYNPLEGFNHNSKISEEQLDRMIEDAYALMEEHKRDGEDDKVRMDEKLLKRYKNQKINFHSN